MIKRALVGILFLLTSILAAPSNSFIGGPPTLMNQYSVPDFPPYDSGYNTVSGRTEVSPVLVPGETTLIFIVAGQSLAANYNGSLYTPTHATKVQQLNVYDGKTYQLVDPVLGASGTSGSYIGRLGDALIDAGKAARVIFIPVAIGGSGSFAWAPGTPNVLFTQRLITAYSYARLRQWPVSAFLWDNGQTDANTGVTAAQYTANMVILQGVLAGVGFNGPMFIAIDTMFNNSTNATIQQGQTNAVSHPANRWQGPNIDSLTGGTNRQADGTHLTSSGASSAASLWVTALSQLF